LAQTVVTNPTTSQNIAQPAGTSFNVNRQGSIRFADQFSGADACGRISTAIGDLPSTGGIVDARKFEGAQTCASNPFGTSTKPVTLLLGAATLNLSIQLTVNTPTSGKSVIQGLGEATNIVLLNTSAFVQLGSNTEIKDLVIQSSLTTTINGGVFTQGTTNVTVQNVAFIGGGHQLNLNTVNNFRIIGTRHTGLTAPGGAIVVYNSDHGTVREPRVEASTWPSSTSALRAIGFSSSSYIDVENPIVRNLDATQVVNFGALSFAGSHHMTLSGGQLTGNKGADGFVSENGSADIDIVGTISSGNGVCPPCVGTNGATGDGFDIFNSSRVHLSTCVANGNGVWSGSAHAGIEIFTSSDVTVQGCDASDSGSNGIIVEGSPRTILMGVSAQRNQGDGVYIAPYNTTNSSIQIVGGQFNDNGRGNQGIVFVNGMYFAGGTVATVQGATATNTSGSTQVYGARLENTSRGVFMFNNFRGNPFGEILDSVGRSPILRDDGTTNMVHSVGPCCS
jgi:hypothetical protein